MEEETEENPRPICPYCSDNSGECEHVILDYDASFREYLSGYLAYDSEPLDQLKSMISDLIKTGHKPDPDEGYIKDIWDYAVENYDLSSGEIELDTTAYFNLVHEIIDSYGGESYHYSDEEGAPGYSSAYLIYYASDPEETILQINSHIVETLKMHTEGS